MGVVVFAKNSYGSVLIVTNMKCGFPLASMVRRKWEPYRGGPFGLVSVLAADDGLAVVVLGVVVVADDHVQLHGCSPPCRVNRDFIIPFFREIKNASHFPRQIVVKSVRRTGIVASMTRFCEWTMSRRLDGTTRRRRADP